MTEHKHAAVLRAIAEGREVQWRCRDNEVWMDPNACGVNPIRDPELEWRIKPRTPRRIWVNEYHNGLSSVWMNAPQSIDGHARCDGVLLRCIEFVEVLPDE